jgi:hypothetical protein
MSMDNMSPRDAFRTYDSPLVTYKTLTQNAVTQLCGENPDRYCLMINGQLSVSCVVAPANTVSSANGIPLGQQNSAIKLQFPFDGNLMQVSWWAFTTSLGVVVTVVEAIQRRSPADIGFSGVYHEL